MSRNIFLKIEYDGRMYHGWQIQPGVPTIQGEIQKAIKKTLKRDVKLNGSGRTDRGVHAYGQTASFKLEHGIPTLKIPFVLNNSLPEDIRILSATDADEDFHARFSAVGKKYIYKMRENVDAFSCRYYYKIPAKLDIKAMRDAAKQIVGTHDFKCFQASGGEEKESTVREVFSCDLEETSGQLQLCITGNGFLYNMVRIITGTLVDVGTGKIKSEEIVNIIKSQDRSNAGHTAPPCGLYLAEVYYGDCNNE